jgi:hypothetical protein
LWPRFTPSVSTICAAHFEKIADFSTAKHYGQGGEQNGKFFARVQEAPLLG